MSHSEPQPNPSTGYYGTHDNVDKLGTDTQISSENGRNDVAVHNEEVLEQNAATKGRWFQYLKTKQFWITLILGQGMYFLWLASIIATTNMNIQSWRSVLHLPIRFRRCYRMKELRFLHSSRSSTTFFLT